MKKAFKFGLLSFFMSLGVLGGIFGLKAAKNPVKADAAAVDGVILVTANDSTCSDTKYYSQSGSDKTSLSYTTDLKSTNTSHFTFGQSEATYSVTEDSSNKMYNYVYRPFFIYPQESGYIGIPKASRYTISITFTLTLTKEATGGSARAFAELFFLGNGNGKPEPSLSTGSFNTNDSQSSDVSIAYHNSSNSNNSIGAYTNRASDPMTTTKTMSITFDNDSPTSNNVVRYQLGLFAGCNYASSKNHQTSAVVTMTINSVTKTNLVARVGSTCYPTLDDAMTSASSGSTVNLLANCTSSLFNNVSTAGLAKNLTMNLNGFTVSMDSYNHFIGIKSPYTLTINGGGGKIQNINSANSGTAPVLQVSSGATLTLSNVTIYKSGGANAVINVYGTLTASSDVTITSASSYTNGYGLLVSGSSATVTLNGATISSYVETIYMKWACTVRVNGASLTSTNTNVICMEGGNYANSLYLYGALTLTSGRTSGTGAGHIWMESTGNLNTIYAKYGSTYLTTAVTVWVSGSSFGEGKTIISGDKNSKISFTQLNLATGLQAVKSGYDTVVTLKKFTVYFNSNGGSGSMSSQEVVYNGSATLPSCTFTAPAYHTFLHWNTKDDDSGTVRAAGTTYAITENTTFFAIWYQTDNNVFDEFRIVYLKMDSYTSDKGYCNDSTHHYYEDAKDYFNNSMTKNQRVNFAGYYADAWARFNAWASANEEEIVLESGDYVINHLAKRVAPVGETIEGNVAWMIGIVALASALMVAGALIIKRKRHN